MNSASMGTGAGMTITEASEGPSRGARGSADGAADGAAPARTVADGGSDRVHPVGGDDRVQPGGGVRLDSVPVQDSAVQDGTVDGRPVDAATDGAPTDRAPTDGAATDGAATDRAPTDGAATDGAATDRAATDGAATDRAATDRAATDRAATDRAATDRAATDRAPTDGAPTDVVDPAYAVEADLGGVPQPETAAEPLDGRVTDEAYLVDETGPGGPPVDTAAPGSLAAVVAEHLAGPTPGADGDGSDRALAVLDVLRASGWSDSAETQQLRSEVERLRELLDMVIRDHRARVAAAASGQNEQAHWLVPLLRAAHGVSFGTLGAKVDLRTAVQDVPADVLASAGLRIDDDGPAPEPDEHR